MKATRIAALLLTLALLGSLCAPAAAMGHSARACVLMDADTGTIVYAQNGDETHLIASTTKIMTALVVLQSCDLEAVMSVPPEAQGVEGSSMYLRAGEELTARDLLYGLMLHSGNDAAVALAIHCAGSVASFVELMNRTASELGLSNTHFANPHGLDDEQNYSSARDLAELTRFALQNETFAQIVSAKAVTVAGGRALQNHNKLLWRMEGCVGVKTGYTKAAGRILVSAARRGGRGLICVTIRDPNDWEDHLALMDAGFAQYEQKILAQAGQPLQQRLAARPLICQSDLSWPVLPGEKLQYSYDPTGAFPSAYRGSAAGRVLVYVGDRLVGAVEVCWG